MQTLVVPKFVLRGEQSNSSLVVVWQAEFWHGITEGTDWTDSPVTMCQGSWKQVKGASGLTSCTG